MDKMKEMMYNQKVNVMFIVISVLIAIFTLLFRDSLYGIFGKDNYVAVHISIEVFLIFFSLAIAGQIWLSSKFASSRSIVLLGALFLMIGIFEVFHMLTYKGMPFFISETSPYRPTWFYIVSRIVLPIGLLFAFYPKDSKISDKKRILYYTVVIIASFVVTMSILFQTNALPALVDENGTTLLKNVLQYSALALQIVVIALFIRDFRRNSKIALLVIVGSLYVIGSDIYYTLYDDVYDIYNFSGHIFQLLGFFMYYQSMYYTSVVEPYVQLLDTKDQLEKSKSYMHKMAYFDEETDLPNVRYLYEVLYQQLPDKVNQKAIVLLEIDRYNQLKNMLNSEFIIRAKKLLVERISKTLSDECSLYKTSEGQFAVFIPVIKGKDDVEELVEKLQHLTETPFIIDHYSVNIQLNAGVSFYPKDAIDVESLFKYAQFALLEAYKMPKRTMYFETSILEARTFKLELEQELKYALKHNELYLEYQPQLDLTTGEINSVEALVRWKHPRRGIISPLQFISIAEESGLIVPLGQWVLETACRQTVQWQEKHGKPLKVAVNLSLAQLYQKDFVQEVQSILNRTMLDPQYLQLEMTETMTMNTEKIVPIINELKALGIAMAVDDFGTGYSSLSYLQSVPLDCLKVDSSFVQKIDSADSDPALVVMIVSLAKQLGYKVVAEGIETNEQLKFLNDIYCDKIQGYYISKPISFEKLLLGFHEIENHATNCVESIKTNV